MGNISWETQLGSKQREALRVIYAPEHTNGNMEEMKTLNV